MIGQRGGLLPTLSLMSTPSHPRTVRPVGLLEALSFFSACYAVGGLVLVALLLDAPLSPWTMAAAFAITWFVYMLHRRRMARRGAVVTSGRSALLRKQDRLAVVLLWASGMAAVGTGLMASIWLPLLLGASVIGMMLYGSGPDGRRVRDMLVIKNACVGLSMACFWVLLALASGATTVSMLSFWPTAVAAVILVLADAMYCDLGDTTIDAQTRSRTAPIEWGSTSARLTADVLVVFAAMLLVSTSATASSAIWLIAPLGLLLSQVALRCVRPSHIRVAVDCRLPLLAIVCAGGVQMVIWTT